MASQSRSAYVNNYMFLFFNHEECEMNFLKFAALALVLSAGVSSVFAADDKDAAAAAADLKAAQVDGAAAIVEMTEAQAEGKAAAELLEGESAKK